MLIMTLKRHDDGVELEVNLSQVCFVGPVNTAKKGEKPIWDDKTCVLAMTNGVVLHVRKSLASIKQAMKNNSGH